MSLPYLLRRVGQQCPAWSYRNGTTPLIRRFSSNSPALSKKSIAEELGLPKPPTKPLLPFTKYMSMGHKEHLHLSWTERIRLLSDNWNKQSPEERAQRLKEYYEEKKEFQLKYKAYISQLTAEQVKSLEEAVNRRKKVKESTNSKREKKKEMERLGRPKYPNNCFVLFLTSLRNSDPSAAQVHNKEFLAHASAKWKALPEKERQSYKEEGARLMRQYELDIAEWEQRMMSIGRPELVRKCSSLHTDGAAVRGQTPEVKITSDAPVLPNEPSSLNESPNFENHNASLESKRETIFEVHPEEMVSQKSAMKVPLSDGHQDIGISPAASLSDGDIFSGLRARSNDLCTNDFLYGENSENEGLPFHVEDEMLHEIESLRLNPQELNKGYGQSQPFLPSMHSQSTFFRSDSKRNRDKFEGL